MVKFYVAKIIAGKMTIADVPIRWRAEVAKVIEDMKNTENTYM